MTQEIIEMPKVNNFTGNEIQTSTYYAIQYGLIYTIAYFSENETWFILGQQEMTESQFEYDLDVVRKLYTQEELLQLQPGMVAG